MTEKAADKPAVKKEAPPYKLTPEQDFYCYIRDKDKRLTRRYGKRGNGRGRYR